MISIQHADFSVDHEYQALRDASPAKTGAIVTFTGLVRDFGDLSGVNAIFLEHYPGMSEGQLQAIADKAKQRWDILHVRILHRIGTLQCADQIVFVGVSSAHRSDAFEACQYIMDYLKTDAPFWKKELCEAGDVWVEAKASDEQQQQKWRT